ncbi:MAG TPA: hypothetical protein VFS59_12680 [Gemmatimonadaceae bacterium]|nr:hypothetical protein [Gemmatimonadaceae bacterium]
MAEAIGIDDGLPGGEVAFTPNPEGPGTLPGLPSGTIPNLPQLPGPQLVFPKLCNLSLPGGCYRLSFRPQKSFLEYRGTLRVDRTGAAPVISGDLYRFLLLPPVFTETIATTTVATTRALGETNGPRRDTTPAVGSVSEAIIAGVSLFTKSLGIPIYPRNKYHSYLKATALSVPKFSFGACAITITMQEYVYTQPPAGQFNGTFPASPGTRTVKMVLTPAPAPFGYPGAYFEGRLYENNVDKGHIALGWVSQYFRRATIEVDTVVGAVAPQAVGTETLRSIYGKAGWDVGVTYDQTNVPIPAGVNANACWSSANLHALMMSVRNPATNLDADWHMHLVVVPATMGCGRGVMYDTISVPREGVASFCNDGYPANESSSFGTAAGQQQQNVPRAFLRSATHETGHGFNQIHQEQEGGADNSIMTTTPSVANVLGGPLTGEPGIFPDNINLAFNEHVRHHLVHFPDVAVRPGGMTFGSGHSSTLPQADRTYFSASELELALEVDSSRIELGEPLQLSWTLTNRSDEPLPVPNDLTFEAQHVFIDVADANGVVRNIPSFVIRTDQASIMALEPGTWITERTHVFWGSNGFAFEKPGHFVVEVRVIWSIAGIPVGVKSAKHVWVNFPQSELDNDAAAELLHPEVGKYVALGGGADHLTEAVERLARVMGGMEGAGDRGALRSTTTERPKALRGFKGLTMPGQRAEERARPVRAPDRTPAGVARDVERREAAHPASAHASASHGKSTRNRTR